MQEVDRATRAESALTPITELKPGTGRVSVRFLALHADPVRQVRARTSGRLCEVCDIIVCDTTGSIKLTLWNEEIDDVSIGNTYEMTDGHVRTYEECMFLSVGRTGTLSRSSDSIAQGKAVPDMSKPFAWKPPRKRKRSETGRSFQGRPGREGKGYGSGKSF
jgi:ssDNA-binding replication factor A large subunit